MKSQKFAVQLETKAKLMQLAADSLSTIRALGGIYLGARIASRQSYRSSTNVLAFGVLAATDYFDGALARKARALDPSHHHDKGPWFDQLADKVFVHSLLGGLACNAVRNQRPLHAAALAINQATQLIRDQRVTSVRAKAQAHDIPTDAQKLGKIKTASTLVALGAAMAPSPERHAATADRIALGAISVGSGLSVVSGLELVNHLHTQMAANAEGTMSKGQAIEITRIAQDDTTLAP